MYEDVKLNPEENFGPVLNDFLIRSDKEDEIINDIEDQYQHCLNLGYNKIGNDLSILHDSVFSDLIEFVNENYFPIMEKSFVQSSSQYLRFVGYALYLFICVDLIKDILPEIFKSYKISEFITFEIEEIRDILIEKCHDKIDFLKQLNYNNDENIDIILIRYNYYIDFLNTDISQFYSNYLLPCVNNYRHLF